MSFVGALPGSILAQHHDCVHEQPSPSSRQQFLLPTPHRRRSLNAAPRHASRQTAQQVATSRWRLHAAAAETEEEAPAEVEEVALSEELMRAVSPVTVPTPLFTADEAIEAFASTVHESAARHYKAFFSSELGGIVTEPALMAVHIDDHMVHRGHAVFDTARLIDGHLYQLDSHLERLMTSAVRSAITLSMSPEQMHRTILETAAASSCANGHVRFWLSAGRGGFGLSPTECEYSSFYVMVYTDDGSRPDLQKGWKVKTTPVPIRDPYFATLKSTNYLPNALAVLDAQVEGFDQGIFVDADGNVAEGPNMNVGILTEENVFVTPPFDNALAGITMQRLLELIPRFTGEDGLLSGIAAVEQRPISLQEAKGAKEVVMTSSSISVMPVVSWDEEPIGTGEAGPIAVALHALIEKDASPDDGLGSHDPVPYGYVTREDVEYADDEDIFQQ